MSMFKYSFFSLGIISIFLLLNSCSLRGFVVKQTAPIIEETQKAILSESEESIARGALEFAIKFSEGLYFYYPKSPYFSGKLALVYAAYAFAFVDGSPYSDFDDRADEQLSRTKGLYKKALGYGFKSMNARIPGFELAVKSKNSLRLAEALKKVKKKDAETLFWLDFAWAMGLFLDLSDVQELAHLEALQKIALRVDEISPKYLGGSILAVLIAYYGGRSDVIGGSRKKSDAFYKQALARSADSLLIADYVYLRFVLTQESSSEKFDSLYKKIQSFNIEKSPSFRFINVFLKRKSSELYAKKEFLFN